MTTNRITTTQHPNGLGMTGYDASCRTSFETLDMGSRGIAVRLNTVRGHRRYMVVSGTKNHHSAYEVARKLAPIDQE